MSFGASSSIAKQNNMHFGKILAMAGVVALLFVCSQTGLLPTPFNHLMLLFPGDDSHIFSGSADLSREQARSLYRQALLNLEQNNNEEALAEFKQLESVYPGLREFLWLHEAECYVGEGNEWAVQKKLNDVLAHTGSNPFKTLALYRIGQSQFRGRQFRDAKDTFETVIHMAPKSTYALGSLYYLGAVQVQLKTSPTAQRIEPLRRYLQDCPDCKFSGEVADLLEKQLPQLTNDDHALIGLADAAAGKELKKTLFHLLHGTRSMTWLVLGKNQIASGQGALGLKTLITGLPQAKDEDSVHQGVNLILAHTATDKAKIALLKRLSEQTLPVGGDYLLWKLAELDDAHAQSAYLSIVKNYPNGDYAPESAWRVLWPQLNNHSLFISQIQQYLVRYPYAHSAPKAMFWLAKVQENAAPSEAVRLYRKLLSDYADSYYAFRSKGRLKVLTEGQSDPGWPTLTDRMDYPLQATALETLDIFPSARAFAPDEVLASQDDVGDLRLSQAKELQAIAATDDVKLLVQESMGYLPPAVESWMDQAAGDRSRGLRVLRDALEQTVKTDFLAHHTLSVIPSPSRDMFKLLYPIYFNESIRQAGLQNKLDPFLIQSLMREESYFNEFAVSGSNARGLMQLMPATAKDVAVWENLSPFKTADLFQPNVNIRLGSRYLAHLRDIFQGNPMPAVGAYNGGPAAMKRWMTASTHLTTDPDLFVEEIPVEQSRDYIKKVFASYWNYTRLYGQG